MVGNLNTGKIVMCGLGFFTFYFSYNVIQNFLTQILEQLKFDQLGFYMLAVICIMICVFSLLIGSLPEMYGPGKLMASASVCITVFAICFLLPVFCNYYNSDEGICNHSLITLVLLIVSFISGYSFAALWIGQGTYLQQCAASGNADTLQGIFWFFLQWSQILGNFVAAMILTSAFTQLIFFTALVIFAAGSTFIFGFLPIPESDNETAALTTASGAPSYKEVMEKTKDSIASTFNLFFSKKMIPLWPYIAYAGMIGAYFCGVVPVLAQDAMNKEGIIDKILVNQETAKMMIFFGIADSIGGYVFGKLTARLGVRFGMALILVVGLFSILYIYVVVYYIPYGIFWWFIEFAMGLCDGSVNPIVQALLAREFKEKSEPFCVFMFIKSLLCFAYFVLGGWLRYSEPYILLISIAACCLAGFIAMQHFPYSSSRRKSSDCGNKTELLTIEAAKV